MIRENVYEEFYGASMESEIIGQEFLAETISIGAIALASWGVYRFFKDAIKAVRTKINESSKNNNDGKRPAAVVPDKNYLEFASKEEYSVFLDKFIKAVKNAQTKLKGAEKDCELASLYATIFGLNFKVKPEPYLSKEESLERFEMIMRGSWAGEDEVYGDHLYLNIHPSTLRIGEETYWDNLDQMVVSFVKKDDNYGLNIKGPKKDVTIMYDPNNKSDLGVLCNKYINLLKSTSDQGAQKKIVGDFLYDFIWDMFTDLGKLENLTFTAVNEQLGYDVILDVKDGDLNDYEYLEQCFYKIYYTGPKTK